MDLTTTYLGLALRTPLIGSACPLWDEPSFVQQAEDAGLAAVVLRSWFADQAGRREAPGLDAYVDRLRRVKSAVQIPVVASLNGTAPDDWIGPAKRMEEAGADAIELNIYYIPVDLELSGQRIEEQHVEVLSTVKNVVSIPVAVKMSPFFTNVCNVARRLADRGADGLVLFNRFFQPDIELETRRVVSHMLLSTEYDLRLPLRWIGLLHGRVSADLAATGGVRTGQDVVKVLAAGARAVMLCSAIIEGGLKQVRSIEEEMQAWMEACEFSSVSRLRGCMSAASIDDASAFERAQYIETLTRKLSLPRRE